MSWLSKYQGVKNRLAGVNWYLCAGLLFLVAVVFGGFSVAWKLHLLVNDAEALPIEAVVINGERQYTSDVDIRNALQSLMQKSFFSADVTEVQETLEALPWVYRASIRRQWPAKLKVFLQEQQAAAHWNGDAWLNIHGEIFDAPEQPSLVDLPYLAGPENMAVEVLTSYRQISSLLKIHGFGLRKLSLSPRHAWRASLKNGVMLELGREDKVRRIQRFIDVYPTLTKEDNLVKKVDLRYDTGLAVGWDKANEESR